MVYLWHIKRKGAGIMNWRNIKNLVKPDDELVKAFSEQWKAKKHDMKKFNDVCKNYGMNDIKDNSLRYLRLDVR